MGKKYRKQPVEPWAFIRVKNEIITIEACLNSILPVITKGVIGYNPSDDGTEEFIEDFCKKNPGFIPFKYDHEVLQPKDKRYLHLESVPIEQRLDTYYNAVFDKIPNGEWFIKIDCDHIYDTKKLSKLMYLPANDNDVICLPYLNFHYEKRREGKFLALLKQIPLKQHRDHWILKKTEELKFIIKHNPDYKNKGDDIAWEWLSGYQNHNLMDTNVICWHFPFLKSYRRIFPEIISVQEYISMMNSRDKYLIPRDMLSEQKILNEVKKFRL
ncbi:hypothetical protein [Riemerella columbipharyngis]|uniref:Beta-1,4-N-acetylgalactosaminyltransferase n=1 Tax=Riemerella columbipharyngis TaxID=1071918 RepID=A0A1G7C3I4_9FLAO|nr:hypothetical protein [Riemerella columbipharyngis]SDE33226.1 beta-1,4-N-acetylgalactosaminyltransferase [Riemerella columbipharyngis]